jgi:hypothetical protein
MLQTPMFSSRLCGKVIFRLVGYVLMMDCLLQFFPIGSLSAGGSMDPSSNAFNRDMYMCGLIEKEP